MGKRGRGRKRAAGSDSAVDPGGDNTSKVKKGKKQDVSTEPDTKKLKKSTDKSPTFSLKVEHW